MPATSSSVSQFIKKCALLKEEFSITSRGKIARFFHPGYEEETILNAFINNESISFQKYLKYNYFIHF